MTITPNMSIRLKRRIKRLRPGDIIIPLMLIAVTVFVAIPIYYLFVTSFKTQPEALLHPLGLPNSLYLGNFSRALDTMQYFNALRNNTIISVSAVTFIVLFSAMASYPLARRTHKFNKVMYLFFLAGIMIPFQILLFPLTRIMINFDLMNHLLSVTLIMIAMHLSFSIFLFTGFVKTIPIEMEEAAWIDGCNLFRTFFQITFPLLKPVIATVAILQFLNTWNDFIISLFFLQTRNNNTLTLEIFRNLGQFVIDYFAMIPMLILAVSPVLILYVFTQRYIIKGVASGSIKG